MQTNIQRAAEWFVHSGIQEPGGGVARYYLANLGENRPVSTEITGYAISTFVYLHSLTGDECYLNRARLAARFLVDQAWDAGSRSMPFELNPARYTYFFDCGMIIRGLLSYWRVSGQDEFLDAAAAVGRAMAGDFAAGDDFHPVLSLPEKSPLPRNQFRWAHAPGCYQLKAAMAWWDLADATGDDKFRDPYRQVLEYSLRTYRDFLPGHPDRQSVMDRLHPLCYFLEGLLPVAGDARCAEAIRDGISQVTHFLHDIAADFVRSDVYAQLLRMRLYTDAAGILALDRNQAACEAASLAEFQIASADARTNGGMYFGRRSGVWIPHVNPVSTAFGLQALAMWDVSNSEGSLPHRHLLI